MIIAYSLCGHDNDSYFFEEAPDNLFCRNCGSCLDETYIPENMKIKRKYDIGSSYDGREIVSTKFKSFCEENYPGEADFFPVTLKGDFFYMKVRRTLIFDVEKYGTRFEKLCALCGNYESIVGATPGILKNQYEPIERGFYRTDVIFGSGRGKSPFFIIGLKTKDEIKANHFTKPSINPVYDELPIKKKPVPRTAG